MTDKPDDARRITRRTALLMSAAAAIPSHLYAQEEGSEEVLSAVRDVFNSLESTINFAIEISQEGVESALIDFLSKELESRRSTAALLREAGFAEDFEQLQSFIDIVPRLVGEGAEYSLAYVDVPAQQALLIALIDENLSPVSAPEDMVPAKITALPPPVEQQGQWHPDLIVVVDILIDAMGISLSPEDILIALIEADPEWEAKMQELVDIISTRDWREVVNAVQVIVAAIVTPAIWIVIKRILQEGGRKALFRLSLRLVPIVGPGYVAAAFLISVKQNWNRFSFA